MRVILGWILIGLFLASSFVCELSAGEFEDFIQPLLTAKCVKCHGAKEAKGQINFQPIHSTEKMLAQPQLIQRVLEVIDANDMPPEGEAQLEPADRARLLISLKGMLRQAAAGSESRKAPTHRLNRFQYNNAVRDLFQLDRDIFELTEKLMTRRDRYLPSKTGLMPDKVQAVSAALNPPPGLDGVHPFPKDLRAEHGFDNQANKLSLSPLLLDAFLRLSLSVVESKDFNERTVGIWKEFFQAPPAGVDPQQEVERRLRPFLRHAFRGPVDPATLSRYVNYTTTKMEQGLSFTESMKKVASAVLCSPMFLYRSAAADENELDFELASKLSFYLWASIPDAKLLDLAERRELSKPDMLRTTIDRMLADPKIERFLDTFPTQWLQLENLLAVTPDPQKNRFFNLDEKNPASLQMVLEPLLLFDAIFVENRPAIELIAPTFSYRSDFLRDWYESPLRAPVVDSAAVLAKNREGEERRRKLEAEIAAIKTEIDKLLNPVREQLRAERKQKAAETPPADFKPYAAWEFNGDLKDSVNGLDLTPHGKIEFKEGMVVLDHAYLISKPLPIDLQAKTLEVWFQLPNVKQRAGGLMGIQGRNNIFDSIVLGERIPQHWISGSNGFQRTEDFPEAKPETVINERLHLAMVYAADGTVTLYRNGVPYGKPFRKASYKFAKNEGSVLFGLRHLPPADKKYLSVSIDKARLYNRALTAEEVAASASGSPLDFTEQELLAKLTKPQQETWQAADKKRSAAQGELAAIPPPQDVQALQKEAQNQFDEQLRAKLRSPMFQRVKTSDPRYGGVITNAAVLSMTSGPQRTQPIARGAWMIEVIFNDPPPPPPNDVPPLNEEDNKHLTIREQFAAHRANPSCAGCHARIDPLGFALENFDITGRWREKYENGKPVDASGTLLRKYPFTGPVDFKESLVQEKQRFSRALIAHLLRFAQARELTPTDMLTVDVIVQKTHPNDFRLQSLIREIALSESFLPVR